MIKGVFYSKKYFYMIKKCHLVSLRIILNGEGIPALYKMSTKIFLKNIVRNKILTNITVSSIGQYITLEILEIMLIG